ncbi:MAG: hypothetical protein KGJ86_05885, partial [Chloroflexota bacterium]|nr:hypothetical protein [Chloroflexota bacterium]
PALSSGTDVYANTPTVSFYGSRFSSSYLDFVPVETETRDQKPLQQMTAEQRQLMSRLDPPGSIPFLALGNQYAAVGGGYPLDVLAGKDWLQISQALQDSSSRIARSVLGNANYLTAGICRITGGQPGAVCGAEPVQSIKL